MSDGDQEFPVQEQQYPGTTDAMTPRPADEMSDYVGSGLLAGKRALVTGGDSGIGRATAVAFAKEGADVAIAYLCQDDDARHTAKLVEQEGRRSSSCRATSPWRTTATTSSAVRWPSSADSTSS